MPITFAVNDVEPAQWRAERLVSESMLLDYRKLVDAGGTSCVDPSRRYIAMSATNAFLEVLRFAFDGHYPLALRPQHFWLLILQAVSRHVNANAEALRAQWVAHEGKKTLIVHRDAFVLGEANDWASIIDGPPDSFLAQLREHCLPETIALTNSPCAGTTGVEQVAMAATTMSLVQAYFEFTCMTMCGFPSITLEGTHADWAALRPAAAALLERCRMTEWSAVLCPLLDKIADQYAAIEADARAVDVSFWESMIKVGGMYGSGAVPWITGWVGCFFPTIADNVPNPTCISYREFGLVDWIENVPDAKYRDYPRGTASVNVRWQYGDKDIPLELTSGFVGAELDAAGNMRPHVAWWLCKKK